MSYRSGIGYDIHKFSENRKLILGGILIPHPVGLLGHSDADVLSHAIADALLGAASLRDIGHHFSDTDPSHKDKDSQIFLKFVHELITEKGYRIVNIDSTIIAEEPKLAKYIDKMIAKLAETLDLKADQVNVKATTNEGLGSLGEKQGIAAFATCSLQKIQP